MLHSESGTCCPWGKQRQQFSGQLIFFCDSRSVKSETKRTRETYLSGCVELLHLHPLLQQEDPKTENMKDHHIMLFISQHNLIKIIA